MNYISPGWFYFLIQKVLYLLIGKGRKLLLFLVLNPLEFLKCIFRGLKFGVGALEQLELSFHHFVHSMENLIVRSFKCARDFGVIPDLVSDELLYS